MRIKSLGSVKVIVSLIMALSANCLASQVIDTNLKFSKNFKDEQIHFIEKINDSITIAASQRNAHLFDKMNLVIDTVAEVQGLSYKNLIQSIEVLDHNELFIGTMKNLMIFNFSDGGLRLVKNISYDKRFIPWKEKFQLRYLTKYGFLGIALPIGRSTELKISFYSEKGNFENPMPLYINKNSNYRSFTRSEVSKMIEFFDDFILINDLHSSRSILFNQSARSIDIIELPLPEGFEYSFLSFDETLKKCFLLSKDNQGRTQINMYNLWSKTLEADRNASLIDYNIFAINHGQIWYKKLVEPERILGLFSLPIDNDNLDSIIVLDQVIVDDQ